MANKHELSNADRLGILQEFRSGELSQEQESNLFKLLIMDARQRQGIPDEAPKEKPEFDAFNREGF